MTTSIVSSSTVWMGMGRRASAGLDLDRNGAANFAWQRINVVPINAVGLPGFG